MTAYFEQIIEVGIDAVHESQKILRLGDEVMAYNIQSQVHHNTYVADIRGMRNNLIVGLRLNDLF